MASISVRIEEETIDELKRRYPELKPSEAIKSLLDHISEQKPEKEKQVIVEKIVPKIQDEDIKLIRSLSGELTNLSQLVSLSLFLEAGLLKKEDLQAILSASKIFGVPQEEN